MTLAIYRQNGNIQRVHSLNDEEDYSAQVKTHNEIHADEGKTVFVEYFTDDSLVAYLYTDKVNKKKHFKDELEEIISSIDCLDDSLRWLRDEVEKLGD